jgi:hypothetical protein
MAYRGLVPVIACALVACASGPHPALKIASDDLGCEQSGLKLHQIYPKKVRVEGCGKEATYVNACDGYGADAQCGWSRQYATQFERANAEQEKAERREAAAKKAKEEEAKRAAAEQEKAEREQAKREKAEQEKAAKAEEKAEREKAAKADDDEKASAKHTDDEHGDSDESKTKADAKKPESDSGKHGKKKKEEGIEAFLK